MSYFISIFPSFPFLASHNSLRGNPQIPPRLWPSLKYVIFWLFISPSSELQGNKSGSRLETLIEGPTLLLNNIHSTGSRTQEEGLEKVKTKSGKEKTEAVSHSLHLCEPPRSPALAPSLSHDTVLSGGIVKRCIQAGRPLPCPPSSRGGSFPLYLRDLPPPPPCCTLARRKQHPQPVVASLISRRCFTQTFAVASTQCIAGGGNISDLSAQKLSRTHPALFFLFFPSPSRACSQLQLRRKTIALPFRPARHQLPHLPLLGPLCLRLVHFLCEQVVHSRLLRSIRATAEPCRWTRCRTIGNSYILQSCGVSLLEPVAAGQRQGDTLDESGWSLCGH